MSQLIKKSLTFCLRCSQLPRRKTNIFRALPQRHNKRTLLQHQKLACKPMVPFGRTTSMWFRRRN